MKTITDRLSFILKPSIAVPGGVGVFAIHDIQVGTYVEVFLPDFEEEICDANDIPEELRGYCLDQGGGRLLCPRHFNRLDIGNYLNHSSENANLQYQKDRGYFASRDIRKGEELLADYRQLGEPAVVWADYYAR